jgi:hypothetical protein
VVKGQAGHQRRLRGKQASTTRLKK